MKVGDKVYCKDDYGGFTGWIASIGDSVLYPYNIVRGKEDIGKTYLELRYGYNSGFAVFKLEHLTLLEDDPC